MKEQESKGFATSTLRLLITLAVEQCAVDQEKIGFDKSSRYKGSLVASNQFTNDCIQAVGQPSGEQAIRR